MEPLIILIGVLLPMLFAPELCANACTESCNNVLSVGLAVVITFLKRLKWPAQAILKDLLSPHTTRHAPRAAPVRTVETIGGMSERERV